jgi:hypothetical protein
MSSITSLGGYEVSIGSECGKVPTLGKKEVTCRVMVLVRGKERRGATMLLGCVSGPAQTREGTRGNLS